MPSTHPIDLSLYLVLDPVLCGGEDGMIETARARARAAPPSYSYGPRAGKSGSSLSAAGR